MLDKRTQVFGLALLLAGALAGAGGLHFYKQWQTICTSERGEARCGPRDKCVATTEPWGPWLRCYDKPSLDKG